MKSKIISLLIMIGITVAFVTGMQNPNAKMIMSKHKNLKQPFSLLDCAFYSSIKMNNVTQSTLETLTISDNLKSCFRSFYNEIDNAEGSYKKNLLIMLKKCKKDESLSEEFFNDLLITSAYYGNIHMVKFLLFLGTDINNNYRFGDTALMGAARNGQVETVTVLIAFGADVNAKTLKKIRPYESKIVTALSLAQEKGYREIVTLLKEAEAEE